MKSEAQDHFTKSYLTTKGVNYKKHRRRDPQSGNSCQIDLRQLISVGLRFCLFSRFSRLKFHKILGRHRGLRGDRRYKAGSEPVLSVAEWGGDAKRKPRKPFGGHCFKCVDIRDIRVIRDSIRAPDATTLIKRARK
jgi:hypothetical protein